MGVREGQGQESSLWHHVMHEPSHVMREPSHVLHEPSCVMYESIYE